MFCSPFFFSFLDKNGNKNLGRFISSPTREKGHIHLFYSDGDECGGGQKIVTNITLMCKPGTNEKQTQKSQGLLGSCLGFSVFCVSPRPPPGRRGRALRSRSIVVAPLDSITPTPNRPRDGETIWCPRGSCCNFPDELCSRHGFLFLRPGAGRPWGPLTSSRGGTS